MTTWPDVVSYIQKHIFFLAFEEQEVLKSYFSLNIYSNLLYSCFKI